MEACVHARECERTLSRTQRGAADYNDCATSQVFVQLQVSRCENNDFRDE